MSEKKQDNRRKFNDTEKMVLFNEVSGRCPICGKKLTYTKKNMPLRKFEIAHIYPANPRPEEIILLQDEERLSEDVNSLDNVIAVCRDCHKVFDTPRTVEEYRKWFSLKTNLINNAKIKDTYELFTIEEEIAVILEKINSSEYEFEAVELSLESLQIDQKVNSTLNYITKRTIKDDVVNYFSYIRSQFVEMDKNTPFMFETIAVQIKSFYTKCKQIEQDQQRLYETLVEWLNEKTDNYSKRACEIVIAYFIQDCEVFS